MKFITEQEIFWSKKFGDSYTKRNANSNIRVNIIGRDLLKNNLKINSALEFGSNVGYNLDVLKIIFPNIKIYGVEINKKAYLICKKKHICYHKSILDFKIEKKFDIVFTSGVLIHQNPKYLKKIYSKIYNYSKKYIYILEYFSPKPIMIVYRNNKNKLFKRDFAKEIWEMYPKLKLLDYGFYWKQDNLLKGNSDDGNWFLFKK